MDFRILISLYIVGWYAFSLYLPFRVVDGSLPYSELSRWRIILLLFASILVWIPMMACMIVLPRWSVDTLRGFLYPGDEIRKDHDRDRS